MARFSQRLAAGLGVVGAFLLLGGSATVAVADPGRSHSDRGHSSDRGNGGGNGRDGPERDHHNRRSNADGGGHGDVSERKVGAAPGMAESPQSRVGSGRVGVAEVTPLEPGIASDSRIASDSNASAPKLASDSEVSTSTSSGPRTSESIPAATGGAGVPGGSGSGRAGVAVAPFSPPRVTVGNGREPAIRRAEPEPRWQAPAYQPAPEAPPPPAAPAPVPTSSWVNLNPTPPDLTQQLGVAASTGWSDPLWGLAGLLLIPVAGAAVGYRQARAAQAAERLRRS